MIPYLKIKLACEKTNILYKAHTYISNEIRQLHTIDITPFIRILDCIKNKIYTRELDIQYGTIGHKPWNIKKQNVSAGYLLHMTTIEGDWLIILQNKIEDMQELTSIIYKCYSTSLVNSKACRDVDNSDRQLHWVWFRKQGYKLTNEIIDRAASWIALNPSCTFHLWTNIKTGDEILDFISELSEYNRELFYKIRVHLSDDFESVIYDWMAVNTPDIVPWMKKIWTSSERQDMIMKTDYSRNIILASLGGMYTDFNDSVCLAPMEPVLEAHAGSYLGVTDRWDSTYASNYWMYGAKDSKAWNEIVVKCINTLPNVYNLIYCEEPYTLALKTFELMRNGKHPDISAIIAYNTAEKAKFKYSHTYGVNEFILVLTVALSVKSAAVGAFVIKNMFKHNRNKKYVEEAITLFSSLDKSIELTEADFRYGRVDIYSHSIMHNTNLPIFCREQKLPIDYLPFNYLFNSVNLMSFVGHIGDNTSFGREIRTPFKLLEYIKKNTSE